MAIKLNDFLLHLLREGQYGNIATLGVAGDQPSIDVLSSFNKRVTRVWARADWKWYRELLSFNLVANQRQYAVLAASANKIDRIQELIPYDTTGTFLQGVPLQERDTWNFYQRTSAPSVVGFAAGGEAVYNQGPPTDYYNMGLDASGDWNIIVDPVPIVAGKMGGFAKAVLTTYTLADVLANIPIAYFPNGVLLDCIFDGCLSDVMRLRGLDVEAVRLDQTFEAKLKMLVGEQIGVATDNTPITTPLPSTVSRIRSRNRR